MTTTIQIRTEEKLKKAAQNIFENLGLDLSTAINMYLVQVIRRKGIPFEILTENGMTLKAERELLKALDEAKKNPGKTYATAREMFKDILGE